MLGAIFSAVTPLIQGAAEKKMAKKAEKKEKATQVASASPAADKGSPLAGIKKGKDGMYELTQEQFKALTSGQASGLPIATA